MDMDKDRIVYLANELTKLLKKNRLSFFINIAGTTEHKEKGVTECIVLNSSAVNIDDFAKAHVLNIVESDDFSESQSLLDIADVLKEGHAKAIYIYSKIPEDVINRSKSSIKKQQTTKS